MGKHPHTQESTMGTQQSGSVLSFLCTMVSMNDTDLRGRSFLAVLGALWDPFPGSWEGLALLRHSEQRLTPGLTPWGATAGGNPL